MNKGQYSINKEFTSIGVRYQIEDKEGIIYVTTFDKKWSHVHKAVEAKCLGCFFVQAMLYHYNDIVLDCLRMTLDAF